MNLQYNIIIQISVCVGVVISSLAYLNGFQNSFSTVDKHSPKQNPYLKEMHFESKEQKSLYNKAWFPQQTKKVFIYLVDGLRYDQVVDLQKMKVENNTEQHNYYGGIFTSVVEKINEDKDKTNLFKGMVDTQTMTITRIKALTTGTIPTFMSMFDQISSEGNIQDNFFYQLKQSEGQIIYQYGVDLWNQYFQQYFDFQKLNINSNLKNMADNSQIFIQEVIDNNLRGNDTNWTLLIQHEAGMDSLMHGELIYRNSLPFESEPYLRATNISDDGARRFMQEIDDDTTFILFSDHGFSNYGTHGGRDEEELKSVVFGYDKRGYIKNMNISQKMDLNTLDSEIDQIDLLPTLCMLKGIPIPSNNLGVIIPDFFLNIPLSTPGNIANAYYVNARQIEDYFEEAHKIHSVPSQESYEIIKQQSDKIKKTYDSMFDTKETFIGSLPEFIDQVQQLSKLAKDISRREGEEKTVLMIAAFFIIFPAICSIFCFLKFKHSNYEPKILNSIILYFILGFIALHLLVFFLLSKISIVLLLAICSSVILVVILIDCLIIKLSNSASTSSPFSSLYNTNSLKNQNENTAQKLDIFDRLYIFLAPNGIYLLLIFFFLCFLDTNKVDNLDETISILLNVTLLVLQSQVVQNKTLTLIEKKDGILSGLVGLFFVLICNSFDPFAQRDKRYLNEKFYFISSLVTLLSSEVYNTLIPLAIFGTFFITRVRKVLLKDSEIENTSKKIIFFLFNLLFVLLAVYFSLKSHFYSDFSLYFFRNFFPISCYITLIILMVYLWKLPSLSFIQKYQLVVISTLPSFLFLMDRYSIFQIFLFYNIISIFSRLFKLLKYNEHVYMPVILTIISFFFFFASGHKLTFEYMHLQTHSTGLIFHNDLFSNVNVFLCNYAWFFLAFLQLPLVLEFQSSQQQQVISNTATKLEDISQNDSSYSQPHQYGILLEEISKIEKGSRYQTTQIKSRILAVQQKDILKFSKALVLLSLPIILGLAACYLRNLLTPFGSLHEKYSTYIVFLTTIYLTTCLFSAFYNLISIMIISNRVSKVQGKEH